MNIKKFIETKLLKIIDNEDKARTKQRANSVSSLYPTCIYIFLHIVNLHNIRSKYFQFKTKYDEFKVELAKIMNNKKFIIVPSEIFTTIYSINSNMKQIFEIMRSYIYQFEEVRRLISNYNVDNIREAKFTITESFSIFYQAIEIINKLGIHNINHSLKIFVNTYTNYINAFEKRITQLEEKLEKRSSKAVATNNIKKIIN